MKTPDFTKHFIPSSKPNSWPTILPEELDAVKTKLRLLGLSDRVTNGRFVYSRTNVIVWKDHNGGYRFDNRLFNTLIKRKT